MVDVMSLGPGQSRRIVPNAELDAYVDNYCKLIGENAPLTMHIAERTVEELSRLDGEPAFKGRQALDRSVSRRRRSLGDGRNRRDLCRCPSNHWRSRRKRMYRPSDRGETPGVGAFVEPAIGKMVTICRTIRHARATIAL